MTSTLPRAWLLRGRAERRVLVTDEFVELSASLWSRKVERVRLANLNARFSEDRGILWLSFHRVEKALWTTNLGYSALKELGAVLQHRTAVAKARS